LSLSFYYELFSTYAEKRKQAVHTGKKAKAQSNQIFDTCCYPMRRRDKGYRLRIGRLIELLALFLYAELVIYAEKGKQAPHTREGITTGGALLKPKVLKA